MRNSMGIKLINELLENPSRFYSQGKSYLLLQEYFSGFSLETLGPLFSHDDLFARRAAIWIASELGSNGMRFIDDAIALLKDDDRYIRHYALEVIAVCAVEENLCKFANVVSFLECEDEALWCLVMLLILNANQFQLMKCAEYFGEIESYNEIHLEGLKGLLENYNVTQEQVKLMLCNDNHIVRRYGQIIAKKKFPDLEFSTLWNTLL